MSEAAALVSENAIVGVGCGIFRSPDAEGPTLFHALENEI